MLSEIRERLGKFGLRLHEDKARLIEFARFAAERRAKRARGGPRRSTFSGLHIIAAKAETDVLS